MIVAPCLSLFSPLFAMRRSWVPIPSRPPVQKETYTIFESGQFSKSISAISPLIKLSRAPRFLIHGDLLAAVAARPNWTRTTSLVETVTMLRGPKFSSHAAVFADHSRIYYFQITSVVRAGSVVRMKPRGTQGGRNIMSFRPSGCEYVGFLILSQPFAGAQLPLALQAH